MPWFVAWIDGQPDFRVAKAGAIIDAWRFELCWVCGKRRGRNASFVIGPMCAVNRVSAEPPSHRECAEASARICPFLTTPRMVRREGHMPADTRLPAGTMIPRNPGVALVWSSRNFRRFVAPGGHLFDIGDPVAVSWWAEGRPATRDEVLVSIGSGYPLLLEMAQQEGTRAVRALEGMRTRAEQLVPA